MHRIEVWPGAFTLEVMTPGDNQISLVAIPIWVNGDCWRGTGDRWLADPLSLHIFVTPFWVC